MITAGPFIGGTIPSLTVSGSLTANGQPVGQPAAQATNYALVNGTGTIVTFTTPNDGREHAYLVVMTVNVTLAETGGACQVAYTSKGQAVVAALDPGTRAAGTFETSATIAADPNTAVTVSQSSALTAGTATLTTAISGA